DYDDEAYRRFAEYEIIPRLGLEPVLDGLSISPRDAGEFLEHVHPWAILRLLAQNPANLELPVVWRFADIVDGGWKKRENIHSDLPTERQFLLVTEGNSDTNILKRAFGLLRPQVSDFFGFIDMENGYPFTGTGNLGNFCRGLVKIGVLNNILVIY